MPFDGCKDKKITFVLGAGASIPFIRKGDLQLTTGYLTQELGKRDNWNYIFNELTSIPSRYFIPYNFDITVDDVLEVIEMLKKVNEQEVPKDIREKFPFPEKINDVYGIGEINFEHILYLIDRIANDLYFPKSNIENILLDLWGGTNSRRQELSFKKGWGYIPFLCREVLIKAILDLWVNNHAIQDSINRNKGFFTWVLENFKAASVYSLNYDPLLYEAVKEVKVKGIKHVRGNRIEIDKCFETGFCEEDGFNPKSLYLSDNIISFLHGHVAFVPGGKATMYFEDDYSKAQKKRIEGVVNGNVPRSRVGMKGSHYNVSLISGLDKFEGFYENPYACYIQRFSEDFMESDYIVLIGTALNDYHLNLFIANALLVADGYAPYPQNLLALRKMVVPKKIVIVTLEPQETTWDNFFTAGQGTAIHNLLKNGILVENGHRVNSELRDKRYAQINKDFFLYLKGTEDFFFEKDKIFDLF